MECKAAILGAGSMGKRHAETLIRNDIPLVAVCDSNPASLCEFKAQMKIPELEIYQNFNEMLDKSVFSLLIICLPPFAQNGRFEKAADAGKHIFIEKPIALNTSDAKKMVQAAHENHITTSVGFHMRSGAAVQKLSSLIDEGKAGRPVLFNGRYQCNSLHSSWWRDVSLSGGQILEQAIHIFDMCRYLFGDPKYASGIMGNLCHSHIRSYTVEDVSTCYAGFVSGAIASITANNCAIPEQWESKMCVVFENLTVEFEDYNNAKFTFTNGSQPVSETVVSEDDPYEKELMEFVRCAERGVPTSCDIIEGYKSLSFVETVIRSAKMDGAKILIEA